MSFSSLTRSTIRSDKEGEDASDERPLPFVDFHSRLRTNAATAPSSLALSFPASSLVANRVDVTYSELVDWSLSVARVFSQRFKPSQRAVLLLPAAPEFAVAFLACLAARVIAVPQPLPLDDGSRKRVLSVAQDCSPSAIVSMQFVYEAVSKDPAVSQLCHRYKWILLDHIQRTDLVPEERREVYDISPDEIAFLQYTSGSTSSPRGVMVSHRNLMANEAAINDSFEVSAKSTIVSWLPLHHDMGLVGGLLQPLYAGARGVILDPNLFVRRPASWLEAITNEQADISGGPNFAYDLCTMRIGARQKAQLDLRSWRVAFNGAAPVYPQTMRSFSEAFREVGFRASSHVPCYGLAEATLFVTAATGQRPRSRSFSADALESAVAREADPAASSLRELVAYPLPAHARVRVIDRITGQPLKDGCVGEIVLASESNAPAYWGERAKSAGTFDVMLSNEPGVPYLRTGDLGFIFNQELFIQGRSKDVIIHRGRNLHPDDLEADVAACDEALRPGCGVVFGMPHDHDEVVVVCQEIYRSTPPDRYSEIVYQIRSTLTRIYGVATHAVVLVPPHTIPKTTSGKLQRHLVAQRFLDRELNPLYSHTIEHRALQVTGLAERLKALDHNLVKDEARASVDTVTAALCEHLRDLLDLPITPSSEESLTSLGVDSLAALQLQYEIEEAFGIVSSPSMTLRAASIADLAAAACSQGAARTTATTSPQAGDTEYELTVGQRALWFLQQVSPQSTAYNITRAFRVTGALDIERLTAALTGVIRRHPSLRLSVTNENGEPRPHIKSQQPARIDVVDARSWDERNVLMWHRQFALTPFDLERDPLIRAVVLCRTDDWLLVLSLHHIICDGASLAIIVSELTEEYSAGPAAVSGSHLGPSPGAAEQAILNERGDRLAEYWRNELVGEIPQLSLPDPGRGERNHGISIIFTLDENQTSKLVRLARDSRLTLHNVLLAAWQVLLHRLSGQSDIVIGVPTFGRNDRRLANWVGNLVNVVPLRSSFDPAARFIDFATQTQRRVFGALDHQELPLSTIIRLVNPDRDTASSTIFQAMFAYYTPAPSAGQSAAALVLGDPEATLSLGSGTLHSHQTPNYTTQADVCLNVSVFADTLMFELQSDPEKISLEQVNQLRLTLVTLLKALSEHSASPVSRLPLLTPDEVEQIVAKSCGPRKRRPVHYLNSFAETVERWPDHQAVDDGVIRLSYAEVNQRSNYVAMRLRELGVRTDKNVVVSAARSVDYLVALLGIHKANGCYVPISPSEAPQRAAAMIAAINPVVCIADQASAPLLTQAFQKSGITGAPKILDFKDLTSGQTESQPFRSYPAQGSAYIIHTSGSTGAPKPAISTNAGLTNHLWQMIEYFDLGPEDCIGQTGPVSFDVSVWQLLAPLIIGARVRIVPEPISLSPNGLLDATVNGEITLLEIVPSALVALLDAGLARSPASLRIMIATGEALNSDIPRRWAREMPALPLYNAYGPCECTDDVSIGLSAWGPDTTTSTSIGRPLTNTSMLILDDHMQPVPYGVAGWLCVGGAGVGRGYLGNPRRTAEVFTPDPWSDVPGARLYRTGDLARMATNGDVEFLGRADDQIKIRGLRIEPGEVEAALCECDGVVEAAAKVEHGPAGPFIVAFIVMDHEGSVPSYTAPSLSPDEDERLRVALVERLPRHMIPSALVRVSRLPRSANGKTDYRALTYTPLETSEEEDDINQPADFLAGEIRSLWAALLGREAVAWHDNFFQLGGHSLLALSMIDQLGRVAERELNIDLVFAYPRLRDFVTAVRRARPRSPDGANGPIARVDRALPVPASSAQQRFWFLYELNPGQPTFNMSGVLRMRGMLDADSFKAALCEVLERHQVLLSRFSDVGGTLTWTPESPHDFVLRRLDLRGAVAEFGEEVFDRLAHTESTTAIDLHRQVPFRALLAQCGPADWRFFVSIHHIACDAWSLGVFVNDLADSYNRRVRRRPPPAPEIRYDFADYCRDELARLDRRDDFDLTSEWASVRNLPLRFSSLRALTQPAPQSHFGPCSFLLSREVGTALRDLAGRTGTTPFIFFASALSALIHSGSEDRETIILGTLIAQRERHEWRSVVGPLLNVSVLAIELALRDQVVEALQRTRKAALLTYRSSNVPYQEFIGLLDPIPGGDGSPFEVLLVLQPEVAALSSFDGLSTELIEIDTGISPYPLVVDIEPRDGGYRVTHRFARDRYSGSEVQELAKRFEALIHAMVVDFNATLAEVIRQIQIMPVAQH